MGSVPVPRVFYPRVPCSHLPEPLVLKVYLYEPELQGAALHWQLREVQGGLAFSSDRSNTCYWILDNWTYWRNFLDKYGCAGQLLKAGTKGRGRWQVGKPVPRNGLTEHTCGTHALILLLCKLASCSPDRKCLESSSKVLEAICKLFLTRDVYTTVHVPAHMGVATQAIQVAVDGCEFWISPLLASQHPLCCMLLKALQPYSSEFATGKLHVAHLCKLLFNTQQGWLLQEVARIIATIVEKSFALHSFTSDPWEAGLVMHKGRRPDPEAIESLARGTVGKGGVGSTEMGTSSTTARVLSSLGRCCAAFGKFAEEQMLLKYWAAARRHFSLCKHICVAADCAKVGRDYLFLAACGQRSETEELGPSVVRAAVLAPQATPELGPEYTPPKSPEISGNGLHKAKQYKPKSPGENGRFWLGAFWGGFGASVSGLGGCFALVLAVPFGALGTQGCLTYDYASLFYPPGDERHAGQGGGHCCSRGAGAMEGRCQGLPFWLCCGGEQGQHEEAQNCFLPFPEGC